MKSDAQKFTELTGGCWHEMKPDIAECKKCGAVMLFPWQYNPTYSHADEILKMMKEFCGEERYVLFMAQLEYGNNAYVEGIDWSGHIDVDYVFNPSVLLQKAIEFFGGGEMKELRPKMWVVNLPYAVFAIFTDVREIVVETAPIGSWMKGKHINSIKNWVVRKKGTIYKTVEGEPA